MADELSDMVKARKDLLWNTYVDVREQARHAETLRSNVLNFMIVATSVLIAVIANDGRVERSELALCVLIIIVGVLGLAFSASYTELHQRNRRRAIRIRTALDLQFFANENQTLAGLLDEADAAHRVTRTYRLSRGWTGSTQRFWVLLPAVVTITGIVLAVMAVRS